MTRLLMRLKRLMRVVRLARPGHRLRLGMTRRPLVALVGPVTAVANLGQAAPTVGLIVLFAFWLGFGYRAVLVTLVVYGFLPVLKNRMAGLRAVDPRLVEAARGMGMTALSVLVRVELPLAVPVCLPVPVQPWSCWSVPPRS